MTFYTFVNNTVADASQVNSNFSLSLFGDGSDGAFSSNSGSTSLTQGHIYQYSSFSLTGTGVITTTKTTGAPVIILVQGNVTISTSGTCNFSGTGVDSPVSGTVNVKTFQGTGNGWANLSWASFSNGDDSLSDAISMENIGGNPPTSNDIFNNYPDLMAFREILLTSGTKGGNGGNNGAATPGVGSSGGGSLIILCGGSMSISNVTFNMKGLDGGAASGGGLNKAASGGGGGGGGSLLFLSVGPLTDTGTYQVTGGAGGAGATGSGGTTGNFVTGGAGGASCVKCGIYSHGLKFWGSAASGGAGGDGIALRKGSIK